MWREQRRCSWWREAASAMLLAVCTCSCVGPVSSVLDTCTTALQRITSAREPPACQLETVSHHSNYTNSFIFCGTSNISEPPATHHRHVLHSHQKKKNSKTPLHLCPPSRAPTHFAPIFYHLALTNSPTFPSISPHTQSWDVRSTAPPVPYANPPMTPLLFLNFLPPFSMPRVRSVPLTTRSTFHNKPLSIQPTATPRAQRACYTPSTAPLSPTILTRMTTTISSSSAIPNSTNPHATAPPPATTTTMTTTTIPILPHRVKYPHSPQ